MSLLLCVFVNASIVVQETETLQKDPGPFQTHFRPHTFVNVLTVAVCNAVPGISATPTETNLRYFQVIIIGPMQSPFEGAPLVWVLFNCLFLLTSAFHSQVECSN